MSTKNLYNKYRGIILYGIIGALSVGLDFCIYSTLVLAKVDFGVANTVGVICGIVCSFFFNR